MDATTPSYDTGSIAWVLVMNWMHCLFASESFLIFFYAFLNVDVDCACFFDGKH